MVDIDREELPRPPVVDAHVHPFTAAAVRGYGPPFRRCAESYAAHRVSALYGRADPAIPLAETARHLTEAGVDVAVLVHVDAHVGLGSRWTTEELVLAVAELEGAGPACQVFAAVDPRAGAAAVRELRRSLGDLGCAGLKLHPLYQEVYPHDRELLYPLYEVCCEFGRPVLVHTGSTLLPGTKLKYGRPEFIDEVATDFPDLVLIMTHFGWPWVDEALAVLWRHPRVYMDVSGHFPRYVPPVVWHYAQLGDLQTRFVFGSDYPFIAPGALLEAYRSFDRWFCPLCGREETWKPGVREGLLGGNFLRATGHRLPERPEEDRR